MISSMIYVSEWLRVNGEVAELLWLRDDECLQFRSDYFTTIFLPEPLTGSGLEIRPYTQPPQYTLLSKF